MPRKCRPADLIRRHLGKSCAHAEAVAMSHIDGTLSLAIFGISHKTTAFSLATAVAHGLLEKQSAHPLHCTKPVD